MGFQQCVHKLSSQLSRPPTSLHLCFPLGLNTPKGRIQWVVDCYFFPLQVFPCSSLYKESILHTCTCDFGHRLLQMLSNTFENWLHWSDARFQTGLSYGTDPMFLSHGSTVEWDSTDNQLSGDTTSLKLWLTLIRTEADVYKAFMISWCHDSIQES